jgi:hypothetical protein
VSLAQGELVGTTRPSRHRLRRTPLVVVAGTLALAVGAALAGYLWLRSYDPLTWAGGTSGGPKGSLDHVIVNDGVHDTVYYVSAEEPGTFSVGFDLTNSGRLPVEVQRLALEGQGLVGLRMGRSDTWADSSREGLDHAIVPFEPVTIESGEGRYLVLEFRLTPRNTCGPNYGPGTGRLFSDVSLRYSYLGGFEKTATVQPPFAVVLTCGELPAETLR